MVPIVVHSLVPKPDIFKTNTHALEAPIPVNVVNGHRHGTEQAPIEIGRKIQIAAYGDAKWSRGSRTDWPNLTEWLIGHCLEHVVPSVRPSTRATGSQHGQVHDRHMSPIAFPQEPPAIVLDDRCEYITIYIQLYPERECRTA